MRQVFYLAHPVSGDVFMNCERAKSWLRWLFNNDPERVYIAPWIVEVQVFGTQNNDLYDRVLADDIEVVHRCDGIILTGGHISRGMQMELDAARATGKVVIDLSKFTSPKMAEEAATEEFGHPDVPSLLFFSTELAPGHDFDDEPTQEMERAC